MTYLYAKGNCTASRGAHGIEESRVIHNSATASLLTQPLLIMAGWGAAAETELSGGLAETSVSTDFLSS